MVDITSKSSTLRTAIAQAIVRVSKTSTIEAIINKTVPKGDVYAMSRATGLLGIKKTADLLPDCHPLPIEFADIEYKIEGLEIKIVFTVKTIYKTGVEVEAMHGASIVALNMYDMLKPIDKGVEIHQIKLLKKKGGKSDFRKNTINGLKAVVIVCSDSISRGEKTDKSGKLIIDKLKESNLEIIDYLIIPDNKGDIARNAIKYQTKGVDLIIYTGGTGLSKRDVTPDALLPLFDRRIPGIEETIRKFGQERTPYSMLSRSVAGTIKDTLVLALPGSVNGVKESMQAIFPSVLHIFKIIKGASHD